MKTKTLQELWRKYNLKYEGKVFGQYVFENSVLHHHLEYADQVRILNVPNIVAFNLLLMLCED